MLTVKIDFNLFLKESTLKKLICTKIYSRKIALLLNCLLVFIVAANLCLVKGSRGWWRQNYGWSWEVARINNAPEKHMEVIKIFFIVSDFLTSCLWLLTLKYRLRPRLQWFTTTFIYLLINLFIYSLIYLFIYVLIYLFFTLCCHLQ